MAAMFSSRLLAIYCWAVRGVTIQSPSQEQPLKKNNAEKVVVEQNGVVQAGALAGKPSLIRRDCKGPMGDVGRVYTAVRSHGGAEDTRKGWCEPWSLGASTHYEGDGTGIVIFPEHWRAGVSLTMEECWNKCRADLACEQAVFKSGGECKLGSDTLPADPGERGFVGSHGITHNEFELYTCFAKRGFGTAPIFAGKIQEGPCYYWQEGYTLDGAKGDCDPVDQSVADEISCSYWPPSFQLNEKGCFAKCEAHDHCQNAVYRVSNTSSGLSYECWIGTAEGRDSSAYTNPCPEDAACQDNCFSKNSYDGWR
jgi:hypothetical protein